MPFIGNAGQFSNIHEKNYATTTLRVVEGDALYQAYNPADSHYKLITTLQEVTTIGSVTANTIQFTNPITSLVTSSNIGVANAQPMHTLDVGANVYIDDIGSNTIHTSGTTYANEVTGETAKITSTVTVRDTIVDRVFPKTNDFVRFMSNVGVLNTAPIHTLDIGANVQIDEYGSNTFYTSGNVYSEHLKSSNITVSGTIDTDEVIINHVNAKSTDFVNFTSNVGILNTAPIHTLDIGANVQIDELGSNTFYTSGNVHANKFTGGEITLTGTIVATDFILSGGSNATPTPQLQTVSEVNPQAGQIAFSSDRTLTLSNATAGMNVTVINAITTNSNLVGDNVTAVTTRSNLIADNVNSVTVTATTTNSNLVGDNVTVVTTRSNLIADNVNSVTVTATTTNSNLVGDNVTAVTTNSNLIAGNVTVDSNLIVNTNDFVVDTVHSRVGINTASPTKDLDVNGEIECSSNLTVGGNIIGNGDAVFRKYTIASPGSGQYSVIGPGFDAATVNPTLTLMRGQKYVFDNTVHGSHPLLIKDGYGGSLYASGVTGNGTATVTFEVPMDAPLKLYYQCQWHPAMGNIIYIPLDSIDTTMALSLSNNLVVTGSSNVGIGTASPRALLDVCGPVSVPAILTSGAGSSEGDIAVLSGEAMQIGHWDNATPAFTTRIHISGGSGVEGNVGIANTSPQHKLSVGGSVRHTGLVMSEGTNVDQIKSFTESLSFTNTAWKDTSISGNDLVTGSYIVQIYSNEQASNMNYHEYYTGFMSWYDSSTNSTESSEIILHAAGEKPDSNHIYLRVLRQSGNANLKLKLQMRRDIATNTSKDYIFKFRRMM